MTSWQPAASCACSRSLTRSLGSRRALEPHFTFRGADVVEVLERVGRQVGFPATIRVDQGTEFVSRDLDLWAYQRGVTLDFSRPGKPTDNAFIEAFNSRFRAECLNAHLFLSLADAQKKLEDWRKYYNPASQHPSVYAVEEKRFC
jgi:putative transposase